MRQPVEKYVPSMISKKYSYAALQLANQKYDHLFEMMEESGSEIDTQIVEFLFNQLMIKAAMKLWGNDTMNAVEKEMKQLHWHK